MNSLKDWTIYQNGIYHHHIRHIYFTRFRASLMFNNRIFKNKIKQLIKDYNIEIIICGPNHYLHGYPPFDISVPIVFDYLDYLHDFKDVNKENTKVLNGYYENATKILCASKTLMESINPKYREKAVYVPNGVDLDFFKSYKNFKKKTNTKYISLIGLSISESLFYLDIFPKIKNEIEDIKMILVGKGVRFPLIYNYIKNKKNRSDYILKGFIPYNQIRKYYSMTDVGLNPTLQNIYYDSAHPLKVMEYTAISKPVVSTDLKELRSLEFPNVFLAKPTVKDYIEKIKLALNYDGPFPSLDEFDWKILTKKLEKILHNI